MKIVFLASRYIHSIKWVNQLAQAGHEVHWITQSRKNETDDKVHSDVIIHQLKYGSKAGYYLNVPQLRRLLKEIQPDILNAHNASGYGTLARLAGFHPYVLNAWGSDVFAIKGRLFESMVVKNLYSADALASTSFGMADRMRELMKQPDKEIVVTPFGIDLKVFDASMNALYEKCEKFVIGVVKTLLPKYGIDTLIRAFKIVRENANAALMNKLEFRIYGQGVQREELEMLTCELGMQDIVRFMGVIDNADVPHALAQMDIFCLGSRMESFGVAAVEAMAMKKPVIATEVTGFKEVIVHGESGILVPVDDPEAMAREILRLMDNENERRRLGENGLIRVQREYDIQKNLLTMVSLYKSLLH